MLYISVGPRVTKDHWANPWPIFGGLLVFIDYQWKKVELCVIMSKSKESQLVVNSNEDVASASLLSLQGNNIEDYEKLDIVSNTEFEVIIPSIKINFFHRRMMNSVNELDLSYQKYHTNGNGGDENYKQKSLFPINDIVSFLSCNFYSRIRVLVWCGHCHLEFSSLVIKLLMIII